MCLIREDGQRIRRDKGNGLWKFVRVADIVEKIIGSLSAGSFHSEISDEVPSSFMKNLYGYEIISC